MYSDLVELSDKVYKINKIHWVATVIILIGSISLSFILWLELANKEYFFLGVNVTDIIFLIGLISSNISILFELFNIHLIKINTFIGKTLTIINLSILVLIFLMELYLLFSK